MQYEDSQVGKGEVNQDPCFKIPEVQMALVNRVSSCILSQTYIPCVVLLMDTYKFG